MSSSEQKINERAVSPLQRLPEFDPDPELWSRIQARRLHRLGRIRLRNRWIAGGLSVAALLCVVAVSRVQLELPQTGDVAIWQGQSQDLEQEWLTMSRATPDPRLRTELRLIDLELQAAYDRGATANELIPLWKLRSEALRELIDNDVSRMRSITRI